MYVRMSVWEFVNQSFDAKSMHEYLFDTISSYTCMSIFCFILNIYTHTYTTHPREHEYQHEFTLWCFAMYVMNVVVIVVFLVVVFFFSVFRLFIKKGMLLWRCYCFCILVIVFILFHASCLIIFVTMAAYCFSWALTGGWYTIH